METVNDPPADTGTTLVHRVVFAGKCLPGFDKAAVRDALARHLKRAPATLFTGKPVVVRDHLTEAEAAITKEELEAIGASVAIEVAEPPQPMPPLRLLDVVIPVFPTEPPTPPARAPVQTVKATPPPEPDPSPTFHPISPEYFDSATRQAPSKVREEGLDSKAGLAKAGGSSQAGATPPTAAPHLAPIASAPTRLPPPDAPPQKIAPPGLHAESPATAGSAASALTVTCPNCRERQEMRLLCRACGTYLKSALAAQREKLAQQRAERLRSAVPVRLTPLGDEGVRIFGFAVPDHVAERLTLGNGLRALFLLLVVLVALGFIWIQLRPAQVASDPQQALEPPAQSASASNAAGTDVDLASEVPPPTEEEVVARLGQDGPSVAAFRQSYWTMKGSKAFVISGDSTWTWRAEMPSVTRALAEALSECENIRLPEAPPCKVVSVNNFWQD